MVCCASYDFTVKGGSIGQTGEEKVTHASGRCASAGAWPMVWFVDSGGARIDPGAQHPDTHLALRRAPGTSSASRCT